MRADMVNIAEYIGARLAVEHMPETMQSAGRLADRVNCPHVEKERRCTRPREVQRNNSAESYY